MLTENLAFNNRPFPDLSPRLTSEAKSSTSYQGLRTSIMAVHYS